LEEEIEIEREKEGRERERERERGGRLLKSFYRVHSLDNNTNPLSFTLMS
jgi:hypothetical protein